MTTGVLPVTVDPSWVLAGAGMNTTACNPGAWAEWLGVGAGRAGLMVGIAGSAGTGYQPWCGWYASSAVIIQGRDGICLLADRAEDAWGAILSLIEFAQVAPGTTVDIVVPRPP